MASPSASSSVHIGIDVLQATLDDTTGSVMLQVGDVLSEQAESDRVEHWQQAGFCSMPAAPKAKTAACQAIVLKRGDFDACIATKDIRGQEIVGNLKPGETCMYAGGADGKSQGRVLIKDNGSVSLVTTDNNKGPAEGGQTVALRISPEGGLEFICQWGSIVLDQTGFHVKTAAGPRIDMGGATIPGLSAIPGVSAVINSMAAYATITAPFVNVAGANVTLGMGPLYNASAVGMPALLTSLGSPPPAPISIASISALTTSATVWVSQ